MSSTGMASAKTFSSPHKKQRIVQTLATGTRKNDQPQNRRKNENGTIAVRTHWQRICVSAVEKRAPSQSLRNVLRTLRQADRERDASLDAGPSKLPIVICPGCQKPMTPGEPRLGPVFS